MTPSERRSPDFDRLQAYLDGQLSDAEVRSLEAELKADPQLCVELVRLARDEGVLLEWARSAVVARDWNEPTNGRIQPGKSSSLSRRAVIGFAVALAAMVLLAVGLGRWGMPLVPHETALLPLAHLWEVEGEVVVVSPTGVAVTAKNGQNIYPGQQLRTGDGSYAVLQYGSSARLEVGAETVIRLPSNGGQPGSIRLEEGSLTADFLGQPDSNPMFVQTPHAEARASGSRVSFSSAPGGTLVDPEEGTIEVTRISDGQSIQVPTGSYAIAASEREPFVPRPLPARFTVPRETFREGSGPVQLCAVSPDGKLLASGGWDGTVKLWNVTTGAVPTSFSVTTRSLRALAWSHDGRWIATAAEERERDRMVRIWDAERGRELAVLTFPAKTKISALAFSPDGTTLATGGGLGGQTPGEVRLWDTRTWMEPISLSGHPREVISLAFSPDGKYLATGSTDGCIRLCETATRTVLHTIAAHEKNVRVLTFHPEGDLLVSGGRDGLVRFWNVQTGEAVRTLRDHTGEVRGLAFSSDGRVLATSGADRMVRLYDGDGGRERVSFRGDKHNVCWVDFSRDGRTLFTAGWDKTIKLWDLGEDEPPPQVPDKT